MNKYEEALDWFNGNKGWIDWYEFPKEYQDLFELLLNKSIPMKPITNDRYCGNCDKIRLIPQDNYCKNCGQKIDWSKNED